MKNKSQKQDKKPVFSHDSLFKFFYSQPELAKELFQLIFLEKGASVFDLSKMRIEKDTFGKKRADLIFSAPFKHYPGLYCRAFVLFEHKSYYDKNLFSQALEYQVLMREHCIRHFNVSMPSLFVLFDHRKGSSLKYQKTLRAAPARPSPCIEKALL